MDYKNHKNLTIGTNFELIAQEIFTLESADIKSFNINFEFSLEKCMERIPWFADAVTEDAYVYLDIELIRRVNGTEFGMIIKDFYWIEGVWKDGDWKHGIWQDGIWENGTWINGVWQDGTWENGTWVDGSWKNGTWYNGIWENGRWKDGIWYNGLWKDGLWRNGTWEYGRWENGRWEKGIWLNGTCINCYKLTTVMEYNDWYDELRETETYIKGKWVKSQWYPNSARESNKSKRAVINWAIYQRYQDLNSREESPLDDKFWEE